MLIVVGVESRKRTLSARDHVGSHGICCCGICGHRFSESDLVG